MLQLESLCWASNKKRHLRTQRVLGLHQQRLHLANLDAMSNGWVGLERRGKFLLMLSRLLHRYVTRQHAGLMLLLLTEEEHRLPPILLRRRGPSTKPRRLSPQFERVRQYGYPGCAASKLSSNWAMILLEDDRGCLGYPGELLAEL